MEEEEEAEVQQELKFQPQEELLELLVEYWHQKEG